MRSNTVSSVLAFSSLGATSQNRPRQDNHAPDAYDSIFGAQNAATQQAFTDYFTDANGQAPGIDYTSGGAYITGSDYYTLPSDGYAYASTISDLDYAIETAAAASSFNLLLSSAIETEAATSFKTAASSRTRTASGSSATSAGSRNGGSTNNDDHDDDSSSSSNNGDSKGDDKPKNAAGALSAHSALASVGFTAVVGAILFL